MALNQDRAPSPLEPGFRKIIAKSIDACFRYAENDVNVASARGLAAMGVLLETAARRNSKGILPSGEYSFRQAFYVSCDVMDWATLILANLSIDGFPSTTPVEEIDKESLVRETLPALKVFLGTEYTTLVEERTVRFLAEFVALCEIDQARLEDHLLHTFNATR